MLIEELSIVVNSSLSAAVQFVALTECISKAVSLLSKKRPMAVRAASDDMSLHISR